MSQRVYTRDEQHALTVLRDMQTKQISLMCRLAPEVLAERAKNHREWAAEASNAHAELTIHEAKP
jgi:hypothetical protein